MYENLRQLPVYWKDMRRMAPRIRKVTELNLTSVLDSEIHCTLCGGSKLAIVQSETNPRIQDCPNCFDPKIGKATGKMRSRTSEEQWLLNKQRRGI